MASFGSDFDSVWFWLRTPLSGSLHHEIDTLTAWHGRLMMVSWGVLVPLGIGVARYYKITRLQNWPMSLDNKFWWNSHRLFQYAATLLMTLGALLIVSATQGVSQAGHLHAVVGWTVLFLGWAQILSALGRGTKGGPSDPAFGDHYHMTRRRRAFEYTHKVGGYIAALLAAGTLMLGLKEADSPRWMPIVVVCWWALLLLIARRLQREGRCIDTYQAIWGPNGVHPGNHVPPIGWGIRRIEQSTSKAEGAVAKDRDGCA